MQVILAVTAMIYPEVSHYRNHHLWLTDIVVTFALEKQVFSSLPHLDVISCVSKETISTGVRSLLPASVIA